MRRRRTANAAALDSRDAQSARYVVLFCCQGGVETNVLLGRLQMPGLGRVVLAVRTGLIRGSGVGQRDGRG